MDKTNNGITSELIDEILANVKILEGIETTDMDELLTLYINIICNHILIKTNRKVFIPELKYVAAILVQNALDSNSKVNKEITNSISSMTEYDRTVNFGASSILANRLNLIAQKQLDENDTLINKFKLLYKT